ncbi:MAG: NuoM family protein [Sphingobacteriales bacterium]
MELLYILAFPIFTMLVIMLAPARQSRIMALVGSVLQLVSIFWLYFSFKEARIAGHAAPLLFEYNQSWFPSMGIDFHIGVDGISIAMMLLTSLVAIAGVLVSWNIELLKKEFFFFLHLLAFGAYGFFISQNLILLFFFLEIAVVPKYLFISIWGSGNKNYSANKLALMLMLGSALILIGILVLFFSLPLEQRTFDLIQLAQLHIPLTLQHWVFPLVFLGFGIFTAMFPFHTWVPDGHSSAPTAGSMFLAGISMKLGGYGALRAALYIFPDGAREFANIIIVLATIAIIYGAFATMMQKDLKYINAYSSISHTGFVLLGLGMLTKTAIVGAIMQMVSHGLMTALFFAIIGMVYERTHTKYVAEMGGLIKVMPFIMTCMFIAGFASLGLPGLSGFVAEMTIFIGSWEYPDVFHRTATVIAAMSIVVTAVYILRAVGKVSMGPLGPQVIERNDAKWNEQLAAGLLIAGILAMGLAPFWLNELITPGVNIITNKLAGK